MRTASSALLGLLCLLALCTAAPAAARRLMQQPAAYSTAEDEWIDGRATWFEHPWTGSCGYGKLDGYDFGIDAVAAMPDVFRDYNTSCGRCYEVKCRGIQAISADGSVNLDRGDACYNTTASILVKIVDTCPCNGNEKWCCGDMDHFDLSSAAFSRLAPLGKGIIGLRWRPVPCSKAAGAATPEDWAKMHRDIALGAGVDVFVGGELGLGWKKTVYGDAKHAMYTYDSSIVRSFGGGQEAALCGDFQQYGGMDFHTQKGAVEVFLGARGVEYWVNTQAGAPDAVFRLGNIKGPQCRKELKIADYLTGETEAGWTKAFFPLDKFDCNYEAKLSDVNRLQWEVKNPSGASICVRDVKIVRDGAAAAPPAGTAATPAPEAPGATSPAPPAGSGAQASVGGAEPPAQPATQEYKSEGAGKK